MERKTITIACLIIAIVAFIAIFVKCRVKKPVEPEPYPIDSLLLANDSLQINLDSIDTQIIDLNEWYEKTQGIILNQSADSDLLFFTEYINSTTVERLSCSNNN